MQAVLLGTPCPGTWLDAFVPFPDFTLAVTDKAEVTHLPALAQGLGAFEIDVVEIAVVDDITVAEHRPVC